MLKNLSKNLIYIARTLQNLFKDKDSLTRNTLC